ncbi:FUSC family protein [Microvirga pudoricolor]|uniref:FUSC family protein n=1 Tax=Microvirga pudoricolor TaxID=2778729 RepID=UPI00194E24D4|nr:FUSC family protein [Microvirga pudoricolor]
MVFSIKTFGAAVLALFIAFKLSLTQPSWAMLTVFVVSQPIAGMVVAKSLFRVVGTVMGGATALVLVGLFAQNGPVFLLALALWIGACTFTSVLLRDAPAAYGALLSGYTAAIVGIPSALAPDTAFDYTIGRCLEILLGIGCATLVSQLVFPKTAGTALKGSVEATIGAVSLWIGDVLRGRSRDEKALDDQQRMIADVIALDALRVFSAFDTPSVRAAADVARHLQGQLLNMLSLLVSIHDRMAVLREHAPAKEAALQPLLGQVADLLDHQASLSPGFVASVEELRATIATRTPRFADLVRDRETILVRNILLRLSDVLETWQRVLEWRDALFSGRPVAVREAAPSPARDRDFTLAAVAAAVSTTAVLTTSAFWIATGWSQGSSAVIFSGVICSILASLDDPATAAANFLKMTIYSALAAAVYAFAVLPRIDGFASLVMVLIPFYIPFGILLALPRLGLQVTPLGLNLVALIGLTNSSTPPDFAAFVNSTLALLTGLVAGILAFRLLRPLGVDWTVRRIRRSILRELQVLADPGSSGSRQAFAGRMFDRINALFTRLDGADPTQRDLLRGSLAALRIGLNLTTLQRVRPRLEPGAGRMVEQSLNALSRHFRHLKNGKAANASLPDIDRAVTALLSHGPSPAAEDALTALVAISSALHRHAGFFEVAAPTMLPAPLSERTPA